MKYQKFLSGKFSLFVLGLILSLTLIACGGGEPQADTSNLEKVSAGNIEIVNTTAAATTVAPNLTTAVAATTQAASTTVPNTSAAATSTTNQPASTTVRPATTTAPATTAIVVAGTPTQNAAKTTVPATVGKAGVVVPKTKPGVLLEPMSWESQTWNNCAPMSALMALSYYGVKLTQEQCGKALRPNSGDKHVQPEELISFVQKQGFKIVMRENGTLDKIKALLSAGVPVITQQWLHEGDDIGHYRVARGYDTNSGIIIFNDSMDRHPNTSVTNSLQDKLWKGYDRRYFPVYKAAQEATVMAILADDADPTLNYNRALAAAKTYSETSPKDIDGWRNLGYLYYAGNDCKSALNVWEQHLTKMLASSDNGPYNRFLWYQLWPLECYNKLGNYQQVIKIAPNEIEKTKVYAEARYEYAYALVNTGRKDEAIAQLKLALLDDPNYGPTNDLLAKLGVVKA